MNLLEILKRIKAGEIEDVDLGICQAIEDVCYGEGLVIASRRVREFLDLAEKWPKFSGDKLYPVPDPNKRFAYEAFDNMIGEKGEMWSPEHPYGALRLELLDWCIEQLEALQDESFRNFKTDQI